MSLLNGMLIEQWLGSLSDNNGKYNKQELTLKFSLWFNKGGTLALRISVICFRQHFSPVLLIFTHFWVDL